MITLLLAARVGARNGTTVRKRTAANLRASMGVATVLAIGLLAASAAQAGETTVQNFFGRWVGEGIAETEVGEDTERELRGLEVIVRDHPAGFQLCWSTLRLVADGPDRQSFAMMLFAPGDAPGAWRAIFSADGSASAASAWAELEDETLRVFNRATNEDGEEELQVYERRLSNGGMELHFTRFDDGRLARVVQGRLEPVARQSGDAASWC